MGSRLFAVQDMTYLPPFTVYLSPSNKWKVIAADGIYGLPAGEVLYFIPARNNPFVPDQPSQGGTPTISASNFLYTGAAATGSVTGMPLCIVFDQQAYRVADGKPSGTVYALPTGVGPSGGYATITIPSGELLLMADFGMNVPCTQVFICPVSYAVRMNWQITPLAG